ncbi:hypothetical protein HMPREF9444_02047 [Succinatimonas hippei YIT 12066]|uniref:Uncharacterized protein n=1 Tax=Succinatimonas hippei (strain DSM 22608 / JCM 16073 / KCTC 15190 / YIT 12066) TaxID=762983 RepID=E8LMQ3_SUCHY|nr:hypothetical protein HMPREF9444_02047 [Succinatimonas hippei YIT 12066]
MLLLNTALIQSLLNNLDIAPFPQKARRIISGIAKPVILCKNHDKITRIITDNNLLLKIF